MGHKLFALLPLFECLDLGYLTGCTVLAYVQEARSVAHLAQERHCINCVELEERHFGEVAMLAHLVSESGQNDRSELTRAAMVTEDLNNAVFK